ncbi:hypothetical protein D9M68_938270 [compost metagenome]
MRKRSGNQGEGSFWIDVVLSDKNQVDLSHQFSLQAFLEIRWAHLAPGTNV